MATSPLVIPGAFTQLATGVTLDATLTTAQSVFTVPVGLKAIPMWIVFRDAGATVNAATTVSVGVTGAATQYLNASTLLQSMLTTTGPVIQPLFGSTVGTAKAYMTQSSDLTVTFGGTLTSNDKLRVDVVGYIPDLNGAL